MYTRPLGNIRYNSLKNIVTLRPDIKICEIKPGFYDKVVEKIGLLGTDILGSYETPLCLKKLL